MIQEAIEKLSKREDLAQDMMQGVMEEIMTAKADTAEIVSFLTALSEKGESVDELTAAVRVMRGYVSRIYTNKEVILDTCGTGADKKGTFNVSTAVAFVASGCGITVAKHGNRAVSSKSGSADILEALGININMTNAQIERCLNEAGIAFLFAPNLHPAMKYAMPARRQIGSRTIFNILGPLTNPAQATHQLVGVYHSRWTQILASVLGNLGSRHALVVYGEDGLDEITTTTSTTISEVYKSKLRNYKISPDDFAINKASLADLAGGSAAENAKILLEIFKGKPGPRRDIVVLNAAAAIYTADKVESIKEGISWAYESIDSGKALEKLELLKTYSNR